jgi:hypothetical protein
MGAMFFAVRAVAGRSSATTSARRPWRANRPPRPRATTADGRRSSTTTCRPSPSRSRTGAPVPEIAKELVIKTGKNAGKHRSVDSLYRAFAEVEEAATDNGLPLRRKPVRIGRPGDPLTPEEIKLRERLQTQPHPNTEIHS